MKVTDTSKQLDLSALGEAVSGPRSPGVHVSSIWRDIESTLGVYEKRTDEESKRRGLTYQLGGFLWEEVYAHAFVSIYGKSWPGNLVVHKEVERDGIVGSPDILDMVEERVIDTKATWKSSNKLENLEKNFWSWVVQQKAYCAMTGWRRGRIVAYFVNGDYRDSGPQVKQIDLEFSEQEVEETWKMLKAHAERRGWLSAGGREGPSREAPHRLGGKDAEPKKETTHGHTAGNQGKHRTGNKRKG